MAARSPLSLYFHILLLLVILFSHVGGTAFHTLHFNAAFWPCQGFIQGILAGGPDPLRELEAVSHAERSTATYITLRRLIAQAMKRDKQRRMGDILEIESLLGAKKHTAEEWRLFLASAAGDKSQGFVWFVFLSIL